MQVQFNVRRRQFALTSIISHYIIISATTAIIIMITTFHCCIKFIRWRAQHSHSCYVVCHTHYTLPEPQNNIKNPSSTQPLLSLIVLLFYYTFYCILLYYYDYDCRLLLLLVLSVISILEGVAMWHTDIKLYDWLCSPTDILFYSLCY